MHGATFPSALSIAHRFDGRSWRDELCDEGFHVWGFDFHGDHNIVETYISYVRKKIDATDPPLIHTIRRVGYTLRLPREG